MPATYYRRLAPPLSPNIPSAHSISPTRERSVNLHRRATGTSGIGGKFGWRPRVFTWAAQAQRVRSALDRPAAHQSWS